MANTLKKAVIITSVLALTASSVYAEQNNYNTNTNGNNDTKKVEYKKPDSDSSQNLDSICAEINKKFDSYKTIQNILSEGGKGYVKLKSDDGEKYVVDKSTGEGYLEQIVNLEDLDNYTPWIISIPLLYLRGHYGNKPINALLYAIEIAESQNKDVKSIFDYDKEIIGSKNIDFVMKYIQNQFNEGDGKPSEIGVPILLGGKGENILINSTLTENKDW